MKKRKVYIVVILYTMQVIRMSYKACADYCPVVTGEEDMCLKDPSCYRKAGVTEVIKAEAPSRVQRIIEDIRATYTE